VIAVDLSSSQHILAPEDTLAADPKMAFGRAVRGFGVSQPLRIPFVGQADRLYHCPVQIVE